MLLIITLFGAYANERNIMDVFVAIFFGLFGYFARRHGYPLISLVIGLILGKLAEGSFHQALMISDHDYSVFFLRPLSRIGVRDLSRPRAVAGREEAARSRRRRGHVKDAPMNEADIKKLSGRATVARTGKAAADRAGQGAEPADRAARGRAVAQGVHQDGDRAAPAQHGLCRHPLRRHGQSDRRLWCGNEREVADAHRQRHEPARLHHAESL